MRPTYKVMYKMVTAREWRCCPGHSGPSCEEGRTALGRARCLPAGAQVWMGPCQDPWRNFLCDVWLII